MKIIHKLVFGCAVLATASLPAAVKLPHVFGNDMVLQQGQKVPVWGKAAPGEKVVVSFEGQNVATVADKDGKWRLDLAPLKACAKGSEFRVKGENEIVLRNVVVGEVWFCSGQSNMEFTMGAHRKVKDWEKEVAAANWPLIRHFNVKHKVSETPLDDVKAKWEPTTPETIPPQSAVAFFFGETLFKNIDVPIGLINCSWGGTGIAPWTPAAHPDDLWILQNQREYAQPYRDQPTVLWNGMVAGLVPYAIKGAIWYQGCHNMRSGDKYIDMTVALVRGWRREWGQGDFPYFLVQLAPYKYDDPKGTALPVMQEAQARIPSVVPNSGYTVINDVGNVDDVHPVDKRTVGMRIAHQVLDRVYGKFVRPWRTPIMKSCRAEGAALRVLFDNAEGLKTRDGLAPTEFELLADDGETWVPADAKIEGESVVLSAAGVASPRAMRFAAYNGSTPNLVNGAGLPAGPFRWRDASPSAPPLSRFPFDAGEGAPKLFYDAFAPLESGSSADVAVVVVHGWGGSVKRLLPVFAAALSARAGSGGRTADVVAPLFPRRKTMASNREPDDGRAVWCDSWADDKTGPEGMGSAADDWRGGGDANGTSFSSYDYIDAIFSRFADRAKFPNLRKVVLSGFSAGGQFAGRYAAAGKGVVRDGVEVVYIAMSPSTEFRFDPGQPWHYGLKGRPRYSASLPDAEIMKNLCSRRVWRGCGSRDILGRPKTALDMAAPAVAQGANRFERFRNFERYLDKYPDWKKQVSFHVFEGVGHKAGPCYSDPELIDFVFE